MCAVCTSVHVISSCVVHVLSVENKKKTRQDRVRERANCFKHMHAPTLQHTTHTYAPHSHNRNDNEFFIPHFFPILLLSRSLSVCVCPVRLCVSFAHSYMVRFYVGHPMKTVLFLALDRPTVSALTYQSSYSGKTYAIQQLFFSSR